MKRLLKSPAVNAVCISILSAFYALVFFTVKQGIGLENDLNNKESDPFWSAWIGFLAAGRHRYIACALVAVTILVVILLVFRKRPYDEYHTSILTHCLVVAIVLTLIAIAVFYLVVLGDPTGIIGKFTLFIAIHWTTIVLADLFYVLLFRQK